MPVRATSESGRTIEPLGRACFRRRPLHRERDGATWSGQARALKDRAGDFFGRCQVGDILAGFKAARPAAARQFAFDRQRLNRRGFADPRFECDRAVVRGAALCVFRFFCGFPVRVGALDFDRRVRFARAFRVRAGDGHEVGGVRSHRAQVDGRPAAVRGRSSGQRLRRRGSPSRLSRSAARPFPGRGSSRRSSAGIPFRPIRRGRRRR